MRRRREKEFQSEVWRWIGTNPGLIGGNTEPGEKLKHCFEASKAVLQRRKRLSKRLRNCRSEVRDSNRNKSQVRIQGVVRSARDHSADDVAWKHKRGSAGDSKSKSEPPRRADSADRRHRCERWGRGTQSVRGHFVARCSTTSSENRPPSHPRACIRDFADGLTNKEIANRFCLSEQTVKNTSIG